ncbi:hypothetical protein ACFFK7_18340 [Pseudoalteromonas xiamenensis]|uniref:hypothetical protein n=1 Tax=Pseudoalteromonas xiamenensis TaxID=882626 RepID=UPI0035EE14A7
MKPYQARILLPLLLVSHQALSAEICEIPKSTLESNLAKVESSVDRIVETPLPSASKMSLIADLAPKFVRFVDVVGKIGTAAGVGIGAYEILDGVRSHNSSEIIDGSLNIASVVAPEIVSAIVGEIAGEAVGGIAGGAAAFVAVEGLNIYNGVKADKVISSIKHQNAELRDIYVANVRAVENGLTESKKIISGDSEELYKVTKDNFAKVSVALTKRSIDKLANDIYNREMSIEAQKISAKNHDENVLHFFEKGDALNKADVLQSLQGMTIRLTDRYSLGSDKGRYIPSTGKHYYISKNYYWTYDQPTLPGIEVPLLFLSPMLYSNASWTHLIPLQEFSMHKIEPVVSKIIDTTFDDKASLAKDYLNVFELVLKNYPTVQKEMMKSYNNTILKRYSWLKFGEELMGHLDYSDEKTKRALVWTFRVLNPIAESFAESKLDKELIDSVNVSFMVSSVISHLIQSGDDINSADSYNYVKELFEHENAPSAVKSAFNMAFENAKTATNHLLLSESDIKPVHLSPATIAKHSAEAKEMVDSGELMRLLDAEINKHLKENVYMDDSFQREPFAEYMQALSKLHWGYNKKNIHIINNYRSQIEKLDSKHEIATALLNMELELSINYSNFKKNNRYVDPKHKWASFNVLPHPKSELNSIKKYVKNSISNL